jgi:nucleoside-diphosphate-sugar epimerase
MNVLVIGGTGPTGPDIVAELVMRGHDVTVLHRGLHEPPDDVLAAVKHIHADPHFAETLSAALADSTFDTVVATYGRMRVSAAVLAGRCERFIGVGGNPVHAGHLDRSTATPTGMRLLADEESPKASGGTSDRARFAMRVREAEESVLEAGARGAFAATYLRYPIIYGRRSMLRFERSLLARARAGRRRILLPDGGLSAYSRLAERNAAHLVGLVLDHPEVTAGRVYQGGDDEVYSTLQWAELCLAAIGFEAELVGLPLAMCRASWDLLPTGPAASQHTLVDTSRARQELGYTDVVRPADVLAEVCQRLWAEPGELTDRPPNFAAEDDAIAGYDLLLAELADPDGQQAPAGDPRWHPYAHPRTPHQAAPNQAAANP